MPPLVLARVFKDSDGLGIPQFLVYQRPSSPMHQRQQVLVPIFAVVFLTCCLCNYVYSLPSIGFPNAQVELHHQHRMWGSYTPYYPVKQYLPPPPDCVITQVSPVILTLACSVLTSIP